MLEGALHHIDKEDNNCEEARAAKKVFETAPMLSKTTTPLAERCSVKKLSDVLLFLSKSSTILIELTLPSVLYTIQNIG